jgi:FdhE protein
MSRARRAPAPADPQAAAVRKRVEALVRQSPALAEAAALHVAWLAPLRAACAAQPKAEFDTEGARRGLAGGLPVLMNHGLPFDGEAAAQLFKALARAAETAGGAAAKAGNPARRLWPLAGRASEASGAVASIRLAAERGTLDLPVLWQALAEADEACLSALAAGAGLDVHWLRLLGQTSLKPALRALAEGVGGALDLNDWQRGVCPICGSPPLLAEVQGKEGARQLRCGLCGTAWPYPRLKCSFCGNTDHHKLGYLCLEGEGQKYRVQTCDVCQGYVKVVVTFDPIPVDLLAVEDLATLHLDAIAAERNFTRAPVPA